VYKIVRKRVSGERVSYRNVSTRSVMVIEVRVSRCGSVERRLIPAGSFQVNTIAKHRSTAAFADSEPMN